MLPTNTYLNGIDILNKIQEKGVIIFGASGEMGSKITSTFAKANVPVIMQDIDKNKLIESKNEAIKTLEKATNKRKLSKKQFELIIKEKLIDKIIVFPEKGKIPFIEINSLFNKSQEEAKKFIQEFLDKNLSHEERNSYKNAMMLLEAGPEVLSFKQDVFRFFELVFESYTPILATNTSSLKISDIAQKVKHKERVVGFHYFLPAHINPLIEIIKGDDTSGEVISALYNLAIAMGKKPVICHRDRPGAVANRILVGVLNEAAKLYDEGIGSCKEIDKIFLEIFYSKQIKIKTKKAQNQFNAAPKLSFFKDEEHLYKNLKNSKEKKELLESIEGKLRQKVLYAQIVENLSELGQFFTPSPCVIKIKAKAQEQIKKIRESVDLLPYDFPTPENTQTRTNNKELIRERLIAAYLSIALEIYNEGIASIHDIELACKEGFKWNTGPFELINQLQEGKLNHYLTLANNNLDNSKPTGIAKPNKNYIIKPNELTGIKTHIENNIGFITLGRLHIQNLVMMQNSLSLEMLEGISTGLKEVKEKDIKAIIFKSQGGGAFSSGADLNYIESTDWDLKKIVEYINFGKKVMDEIAKCNIPTIAVVDGPAVGGGLELALACDYRILTEQAFVAMPEVALGIIPDWGGTERLPAILGKELAKRMICTATLNNMGLKLNAEDSKLLGLADASILQCDLPDFLNKLINKEVSNIDIYKKPLPKTNYNKSDYPPHIIKRFNLNQPFKHNFRWTTKYAAKLAEDLIDHSDNPYYGIKVNNDLTSIKLLKKGKKVANIYIKPMLFVVQNKLVATIFEKMGLL